MDAGIYRWLVGALVLTPTMAVMAAAQQPTPSASAERAKLQADLLQLLKRISTSPAPVMPYPSVPGPPAKTKEIPDGTRIDILREGMNLFRDNNIDAARRTFQLIDPATLGPEDRAFVRYMLASCHRKLGNTTDAEMIYREVANSPDDAFLANCAIWQLSLMRSEQELQLQLGQLRARAKPK